MKLYSDEVYLKWLDELAQKDFVVIDNYLDEKLLQQIIDFFELKQEENDLSKAGIGALGLHTVNKEVRGDYVYWIDQSRDEELRQLYVQMNDLVERVNRYLFLSISDFEYHLAFYPKGTFYAKHLDQFKQRNNRQISFVLYLNENWLKGDGGELRIFQNDKIFDLEPLKNRLVLFKSAELEHEVLTTFKGRYSLTGWMLNNPIGLGFI